ncbi:hypothetical protein C6P47_29735, partial [Klebsiella pneumoniae]
MQERCIGCKPASSACPYGAMEVVVRPVIRHSGVHVMQERCIGCKPASSACPYGAMEVVVRPVIRHSG